MIGIIGGAVAKQQLLLLKLPAQGSKDVIVSHPCTNYQNPL